MRWVRWISNIGLLAVALVIFAGPLHRLGLDFRAALGLMALSALVAGVAGLVSLVAAMVLRKRGNGAGRLFLAGLTGLAAFGGLVLLVGQSRGVPPIHDITTDMVDVPAFVAVLPLRAGAANPPGYAGAAVAAQQAKAYPQIRPLVLAEAPAAVFPKAEAAVGAMNWKLVATNAAEGRIEATATTGWFGFKDDIVIRIRADGPGTRVDVRSKSRVGVGDLGANAKRISAYLLALQPQQ